MHKKERNGVGLESNSWWAREQIQNILY